MDIQQRCARGQDLLQAQDYIEAEKELKLAEREATARHDWDSLSRLYMPLQEARRQRRLRCGEGVVCLDLLATGGWMTPFKASRSSKITRMASYSLPGGPASNRRWKCDDCSPSTISTSKCSWARSIH